MNNISSNNQNVSSLNLSSNSWHAKIYKYVFHKQVNKKGLPNNLCLYFWKTLLATVLYALLFIYSFPVFVLNIIVGSVVSIFKPGNFSFKLAPTAEDCFGMVTGIYMFIIVGSFLIYMEYMFYLICTTDLSKAPHFQQTMGFIALVLNFFIACWLINNLFKWIIYQVKIKLNENKDNDALKSKTTSFGKMSVLFIKAKIGKYCPKNKLEMKQYIPKNKVEKWIDNKLSTIQIESGWTPRIFFLAGMWVGLISIIILGFLSGLIL